MNSLAPRTVWTFVAAHSWVTLEFGTWGLPALNAWRDKRGDDDYKFSYGIFADWIQDHTDELIRLGNNSTDIDVVVAELRRRAIAKWWWAGE